ncbi:hypothetical protein [Pseudotabrizicola alkalilacus]|uniref:DUF3887 domain-containing protein n=1 Tax=Pseudotabrizicola alkalilacus TaxID=2305252 RepID=A0A411Z127_9RHOB|nr:hypothetical protein [Pseudotabrizicola alkalilacus]RGP36754.1 hypothetical protein D1012_13980 [Pseudotabrizicola alkalilacus]
MRLSLATLALCALPFSALADQVSDKLQSALDAYAKGDLKTATLDIAMASGALAMEKQARIVALLPEAPEGWTRSVNDDYTANLAMAGGGAGTEATYTDAGGNTMTVTITADSPMMMGMAGMFLNEQMLAMMGKLVEVPGAKLLEQDNSLTGLIDQRLMVTISGLPVEQMMPLVQQIDFEKLASFDAAS